MIDIIINNLVKTSLPFFIRTLSAEVCQPNLEKLCLRLSEGHKNGSRKVTETVFCY